MGDLLSGPQIDTSGVDKAFKSASKIGKDLKPVNVNAGGLSSSFKNNTLKVGSSIGRQKLVGNISATFGQQAGLLAGLRARVAPGASDLRAARLAEVENARQSAVGNLRENLARRRVLGSSFAGDALNRAELQFGQEKDKVAAESFMQELDLTHKLIGEEFDARRGQFQTKLGEMNIQADLATKLSSDATNVMTASAQLRAQLAAQEASTRAQLGISQAQLDAQAQAGAGSLLGTVLGLGTGGGSTVGGSLIGAVL